MELKSSGGERDRLFNSHTTKVNIDCHNYQEERVQRNNQGSEGKPV